MKAFVLGHPIEHSLSPDLHSAAYKALGLEADYSRLDTEVGDFEGRMKSGLENPEVLGYSVTMPLKKEACASAHHVSNLGSALGVVNTIYWRTNEAENRESYGHNTDVSGIVNALKYAGLQDKPSGNFAVIGGGGTAISAVVAGYVLGFRAVDVFVRNKAKAADVEDVTHKLGMKCDLRELAGFPESVSTYAAVISTLPAHAADSWADQLQVLNRNAVLLDVSYDPWPSLLAIKWEKLGGSVVSGLEMLLYQALEQVKLFSGHPVSYRFSNELDVLNAMCRAIGLPERTLLPIPVLDIDEIMD